MRNTPRVKRAPRRGSAAVSVIVHNHADAQPLKLGAVTGGPGLLGITVALRWGIHYTATHT